MLKKILLCILLASNFYVFSQSHYSQQQASSELDRYSNSFGSNRSEAISFKMYKDPQNQKIFFRAIFKKDRTTVKGKTYYNMKFKVELVMKYVNHVYEKGNKLYFDLDSNGYSMNIKAPRENWIGNRIYTNDFTITINNSTIRKKALKAFKYLVKNPVYHQ